MPQEYVKIYTDGTAGYRDKAGILYGSDDQGGQNAFSFVKKRVTGIQSAVPTEIFRIAIPNGVFSALVRITATAICGAGGAIGEGESIAVTSVSPVVRIVRTAGLVAVRGITAGTNSIVTVAGGTALTLSWATDLSGGAAAENIVSVQADIGHGVGTGNNHIVVAIAELLNSNSNGVIIT